MGLSQTFPCRQWLLNQAYQTGFQSPANKENFRTKVLKAKHCRIMQQYFVTLIVYIGQGFLSKKGGFVLHFLRAGKFR